MREFRLNILVVFLLVSVAGAQKKPDANLEKSLGAAPTDSSPRLPVKRVLLYKNGMGYFEHTARVHGNQDLAIDFTTGRLNDVLKSPPRGGSGRGANLRSALQLYRSARSLTKEISDLQDKHIQAQAQLDRMMQDVTLDQHFYASDATKIVNHEGHEVTPRCESPGLSLVLLRALNG